MSDFMKLMPTGIESFKTMIDKNAYYVEKTNLIQDVLNEQVVLYTRPRRFGKPLNMSMLYYFFSIKEKENAYLFDGLDLITIEHHSMTIQQMIISRKSCLIEYINLLTEHWYKEIGIHHSYYTVTITELKI